ncbi:hypothetical protein HD806DRAFT_523769 [Xylariaceae sp. AK1471]|nr:hypothetical protein HD806DRAFT_523769 [Xylariaceae sp. AK1471]
MDDPGCIARYWISECKVNHFPARWERYVIPKNLLKTESAHQSSSLLGLPIEILEEVYKYVSPTEAVCLSLTCRAFLHYTSIRLPVWIPSAPKHRSLPWNICKGMQEFLRLVSGYPDTEFAFCHCCYQYRPKRLSYWKQKVLYWKQERDLYPTGHAPRVISWSLGLSRDCPSCQDKLISPLPLREDWLTHVLGLPRSS